MFVTLYLVVNITGKQLSYRHEIFTMDGRYPCDCAVKLARWRCSEVGRGARFAVTSATGY